MADSKLSALTAVISLTGTELIYVSQGGVSKQTTAQDVADLAAGVGDSDYGDITVTSSGTVWTIDDKAVTLAKMADMATDSFVGRTTAATGVPEVLSKAQALAILNVEDGADVTDTTNVTAAGALMDSEVDADIKTLSLPASTTISAFGASLIDDAAASNARTTLGVDAAGTDNSTDVTFAGTGTYISLSGQQITVDPITESDISDLGSYVGTGDSPAWTGAHDFGGATSLELPNGAAPTVNADGEIAVDTTVTGFSAGVLKYYSGEEMGVIAMPVAEFTSPTDGHVVSYNATSDEFELVAQSGGSGSAEYVQDISLLYLYAAEARGDRLNMVGGITDPFHDEGDVDTATSTNETHDAVANSYSGLSATDADAYDKGTTIGTATGLSGYTKRVSIDAAEISDGGDQVRLTFVAASALTIQSMYIHTRAGSGDEYDFSTTPVQVTFDSGSTTKAVGASSTATSDWVDFTFAASDNIVISFYSDGGGASGYIAGVSGTDSFYKSGDDASTVNATGYTQSAGQLFGIRKIEGRTNTAANMTLVSNAFTADAAPSTSRVGVQVTENESVTINTDLTAEVSRDGGTTWTSSTLVLINTLASGEKYYEDDDVAISGQPSGTSMKYRIKTLNTKDVEVNGVLLQWS